MKKKKLVSSPGMRKQYFVANNLWEGLLWFPWSCRSTQTSYARLRPQTGHWHDETTCSEMMIYLARWNKKQTNKDGRFLSFLFTFGPDKRILWFSDFNWKIVFSKITIRMSKLLSVFDKLGLGSKYGGGQHFSTQSEKKKCNVTGDAHIKWQRRSPSSTRREKRGDCKLAWISAVSTSRKLPLATRRDVWNIRLI